MKISRYYTQSGQSPYEGIPFEPRKSEIRNPDGSTVFLMDNVMVPAHWSQVATDILAQKYFRKAGLNADDRKVNDFASDPQNAGIEAQNLVTDQQVLSLGETDDDADPQRSTHNA